MNLLKSAVLFKQLVVYDCVYIQIFLSIKIFLTHKMTLALHGALILVKKFIIPFVISIQYFLSQSEGCLVIIPELTQFLGRQM